MNFVEIMNGLKLMCDSINCPNCKLYSLVVKYVEPCSTLLKEYPEEVEQVIVEWMKENLNESGYN